MSVPMPRSRLSLLSWVLALFALAAGGAVAYVYSGLYDISATKQHTPPVYWAVSTARRQSIRAHAAGRPPPPDLADPDLAAPGLVLFERHCQQCHGAPGIAPDAVGLGMNPAPPNPAQMSRDMSAPEMFW